MNSYKSLIKLSFGNYKGIKELYESRINNPCAYNSKLKINPLTRGSKDFSTTYELFYLPINKILLLQDEIYSNSKKIISLDSLLSDEGRKACIQDIMANEINKSNGIEGIYSTKKDIYDSMIKPSRYSGIVNKYKQIIDKKINKIESPEKIRMLYDEIFKEDILKNKDNQPDGIIFRNKPVYIKSPTGNIHQGVSSESAIILHITELINFMNKKDVPPLLKASIVHYYFEYIHPFYDGNGRFGRFLLSAYIARKIDIYTGLSLSYSIFSNKNKYYDLFIDTSNKRNYGEITFFIIGILEFIINGQKSIIDMLNEKIAKINYAKEYVEQIDELDNIEKEILYRYIQNYIFAKENPLLDIELHKGFSDIKSIDTFRKKLNSIEKYGFIEKLSKKPIVRCITDDIKNLLD